MLMTVSKREELVIWFSPFVLIFPATESTGMKRRERELCLLIMSVTISRIVATTFRYKRLSVCARHLTTQNKNHSR